MRKRGFSLFLLPLLLACSTSRDIFPFGEKTNAEKPFLLFRSIQEDGNNYEEILPSLSAEKVSDLLDKGESLSLFIESKTCHSCQEIFSAFKEISKELGIEIFSLTPLEARKVLSLYPFLEKTTFSKGTPGWYLLNNDEMREVLYGSMEDKEALKRRVKTTFLEYVSPYNAFRIDSLAIFDEVNKNFESPTFFLDRNNPQSVSFFETKALPFFIENQKSFYLLDTVFYGEQEQETMKAYFTKKETLYPIRFQNTFISFEEVPSFLESLLK